MPEIPRTLCPICRKPSAVRTRPFCSKRCADIDLGRWFTEGYAVPGPPPERDDATIDGDDDLTG